ncbi:MAG: hypothetical protein J6P03_07305 [Opitutales bacterium]|nr:hypothetical protein [Opitutales bacterium]
MSRIAQRKKLPNGLADIFTDSYARDWFFKVPEAFADSLDVSLTINGGSCGTCYSFEAGDVFYDDVRAYLLDWAAAQKAARFCVRVLEAAPSSIVVEEEASGDSAKPSKVKKIMDGDLVFEIRDLRDAQGAAVKVSTNQFEFARFLRGGKISLLGRGEVSAEGLLAK